MNFQFSPFGIIIYLVYALVIVMAVVLPMGKWILKKKSWKWWVISVIAVPLLVAPVAEEVWIAHCFETLCQDAGVHVHKKVEVDGYYNATIRSGYESIDKFGYRFMEHPSRTRGKIDHITKPSGNWKKLVLDQPEARYHFKFSDPRQEVPVGWKLEKVESIVLDSDNDEIIAREVHFKRRSSLIEGLWIGLVGSDLTICNRSLDDYEKKTLTGYLPYHVFTPITGKK